MFGMNARANKVNQKSIKQDLKRGIQHIVALFNQPAHSNNTPVSHVLTRELSTKITPRAPELVRQNYTDALTTQFGRM